MNEYMKIIIEKHKREGMKSHEFELQTYEHENNIK